MRFEALVKLSNQMERMVSFAQNGEDVVLARAFREQTAGRYVDLGAYHPLLDSVTKHFYDLGWRGVSVEPGTSGFQALVADRPRDVNLNVAIGRERDARTFYESALNWGLSSFSLDHLLAQGISRDDITEREIDVVPLGDILDEYLPDGEIEFLKVDIEGAEDEVIESFDWRLRRPRVLVFEAPHVTREDVLLAADYRKTLWDGINTFWVRAEDAAELESRLSYPASTVLDAYDPYYYIAQIHRGYYAGARPAEGHLRRVVRRLSHLRAQAT